MNRLRANFEKLIKFAEENNFTERFSNVYFVENKFIQYIVNLELSRIPRKSICGFRDFEKCFDNLFKQGHSWVNMHLAGIIDDSLLVIVEVPDYENNVPEEFISVKFSLPTKRISENNWNVKPFYEIVN